MRRWRKRAVAAGSGLLLVACASAAGASLAHADVETHGGYKYVTKSKTVQADDSAAMIVPCPKGTFPLAGGYRTTGEFDQTFGFDAPAATSRPRNPPDDGWGSLAFNLGDTSMTLIGEAVCSKERPAYRTDDFRVPANSQRGLDPECKNNELATDLAVAELVPVNSSFLTSEGAFTTYVDNTSDSEEVIDVLVVCIDRRNFQLATSPSDIGSGRFHDEAVCSGNRFAVSGGQSNTGSFEEIQHAGGATTQNGAAFESTVDNHAGIETVTTQALCLKKAG